MNESSSNKFITLIAELSIGRLAILGAVISGIYYATMFNDGSLIQQNIATLKTQVEEEKIKKVDTTRVLQKEEQMRGDVTMLVKKYEEVKAKIPIEFLESELRIIVDKYAVQYDLKTVKSQKGTRGKDFGASEDASLVNQVALEYSFKGTFFNLEKLVNEITQIDKLIKIENFQFTSEEKKMQSDDSPEVTLHATIVGFKQSSVAINENKPPQVKNTDGGKK